MQNQYGNISPRTAAFAVKTLLDAGQYIMVLERYGQVDPQGKNKTKVRKWRRYESLPRATAPLAEGVVPGGRQITYTDITATLEQFGDYVEITDVIKDTHEDPVLQEMSKRCGEQAAETIEVIRFNVLKAGTNVYYTGTATSRATLAATINRTVLHKVVRGLKKNKAREITSIIAASAKIATEPVAPAFFGLAHTDLAADIQAITGFTPVEKYADSSKAMPGEIGKVLGVRFICSALFEAWLSAATSTSVTTFLAGGVVPTAAANPDVYPVLVIARDAYAIVPLQGFNSVDVGVVNPAKVIGDPMGQKGFVSWKTYQATAILNENWMARIECLATASPD